MSKYEPNAEIVNLSQLLTVGILVFLFLSIVFDFLATIFTAGYQFNFEIHGLMATWAFFLASFAAIYAVALIISRDDSNFLRIIATVFLLVILAMSIGRI